MSAQTPQCQLLARQDADYRGWLWVAPPRDGWLESGEGNVWSADLGVCEAWRNAGRQAYDALAAPPPQVPGAVLFWPKSHALGEWWLSALNTALPVGTPIQVVGENQGGIKRVPKILADFQQACRKLDTARRCTLFATRTDKAVRGTEAAWQTFTAGGFTLATHPGVFGHGKLDAGTQLLMNALTQSPLPAPGRRSLRALDVGCGDGVLSAWLAKQGCQVTAVDLSTFAVEATRRTLDANQLTGTVVQSDVYRQIAGTFEAIVSNPPFHQERSIDYGPTQRLIREAPTHLVEGGSLTLVANVFLPYPDWLQETFGGFEILADDRRFRVYRAIKARH
ncbi:methyltransferase [Salinicola halimionae]|uniref:methyltransferase n=1 Tax=Salinicola halimionae TaxID=1949081 RepID=UPI000DA17D8A|nr:methyltransferase [Salinicola halimionae]